MDDTTCRMVEYLDFTSEESELEDALYHKPVLSDKQYKVVDYDPEDYDSWCSNDDQHNQDNTDHQPDVNYDDSVYNRRTEITNKENESELLEVDQNYNVTFQEHLPKGTNLNIDPSRLYLLNWYFYYSESNIVYRFKIKLNVEILRVFRNSHSRR